MIEFLSAMTALDFLFILIWAGTVFYGARAGIVKVGFMAVSMGVGAVAGAALSKPLSYFTGPWAGVSPERGVPVTYFFLALVIMFVLFLILILTYRRTSVTRNATAEAILGGIAGVLMGLVIVEQLTGMLLVATSEQWGFFDGTRANILSQLQNTPFLPVVAERFPFVSSLVESGLPISTVDACERCL